jgi:hypothetical protein
MELVFEFPGVEYSVDSILLFQDDKWWDSVFHFYPEIDRMTLDSLTVCGKRDYLSSYFQEFYNKVDVKNEITDKLITYNNYWKLHKKQIEDAFSEAFQYDVQGDFNDVIGNITFNPICPRFLSTRKFDVFYLNSERGALGISLHEIIHFVWFDIWNKHFNDSVEDYETPHLKWVFSEMAVDPIMRKDSRLNEINPYFEDGCAYEVFYSMVINGKPILETLYNIYIESNIVEFMERGYAYCKQFEGEIRKQME